MMIDKADKIGENYLKADLYSPVSAKTPYATSWKLILIGDSPGELLENNYLVLNLNQPNQLQNTEWIKPGKIMREMTLSTAGGKKYVDFAAAHNIHYLLYDGGWYGDPIIDKSDATEADPWENKIKNIKNHKGLDLQEVIAYGKQKGVGIFLYLDRRVVERRMDYLLPIFKKWGVAGLKFGFVNVASQAWNQWLQDMVEKCADYELMLNVHDEFYPTGLSRTFPNLLTQEGILGNEAMPSADHNVNLAFTRMLAGAADYTPAYYMRKEFGNDRKFIKTTPAHQLALPVIYYSPLQSLFWYDTPEDYQQEPEIEFWENVPTTWDETKVLQGEIGEYIVIARRKNAQWFIGGITNQKSRKINLPLDYLTDGNKYVASYYFDDEQMKSRTNVGIKEAIVDANNTYTIEMKSSGGFALWLKPKNK
jgi:alpha-glucosidase